MYILFQRLLFISLNLYRTKVHIQHHEYIMIYIIFAIYRIIFITLHLSYYHNIIMFLMRHNVFGYQKTNVKVPKHTIDEDISL